MKKIFISLLCFLFLFSCKNSEDIFSPKTRIKTIGAAGFSSNIAKDINIQVSSNDIPYISYYNFDGDTVYLMGYNGSSWDLLANDVSGIAELNSLAIDSSGNPYLSYFDYDVSKIKVIKYEGGTLQTVITGMPILGGSSSHSSISFINNTLYSVYIQSASPRYPYVYSLQSGAWSAVGTLPVFSERPYEPSINFYGITPYIVFEDYTTGYISVGIYSNNVWQKLGGSFATSVYSEYVSLDFSPSGVPYITYRDADNGEIIMVRKYTGSVWEDVGSSVSTSVSRYPSLVFLNGSEEPYICYVEITNLADHIGNLIIKRFDGVNWVSIRDRPIAVNARYSVMVASPVCGFFVAYADYNNGGKVTVLKIE